MCEQPKIHVFLGAPPPSSSLPSEPGAWAEEEEEEHPSASWRCVELTWRDSQLTPAAEGADRAKVTQDQPTKPQSDQIPRTKAGQDDTAAVSSQSETCQAEEEERCTASLHSYLDSCFPTTQRAPGPASGPGPVLGSALGPPPGPAPGPALGSASAPGPAWRPRPSPEQELPHAATPLLTHTHYLATWTLSQALVLRGRHGVQSASSPEKTVPRHILMSPSLSSSTTELLGPVTPSPGTSAELFSHSCSTPRAEEGGVVLEVTTDGLLCSQAFTNTHEPPSRKKSRLSAGASTSGALHSTTTLLPQCDKLGVRYSVLVAVVHPCHLKEVKVKSGPSAGTFVPLASIVVTDQSGEERKVVLWRRAAFWAVTVSAGDILLITGLQVKADGWRGETMLQSTFSSKLLNMGCITGSTHLPVSLQVHSGSLHPLCDFLWQRRPLLMKLPHRRPQDLNCIPHATLRSMKVNTLIHALLRVTHAHLSSEWRREAESHSRSALQRIAIVTVEQVDGQQGVLHLWGAAVNWLPLFNRNRTCLWDFQVLLVRGSQTSNLPELHSTPWSRLHAVDPADCRLQRPLLTRHCLQKPGSPVELDLETLLSQKFSGEAALPAQLIAFQFQDTLSSLNAPQPVLDGCTPLDAIMAVLSGDITYTGCAHCSAELDTDANGIYSPCYPCLPHTAVRHYYRPGVLTVAGQSLSQLSLLVSPVLLQTLLSAPPDKLQRPAVRGSDMKNLQVAAERMQSLLSFPRKTFIIHLQSCFLLDENSAPIHQDFTLLHLQLQTDPAGGAVDLT